MSNEKITSMLPFSQEGLPDTSPELSIDEAIHEDRARNVREMYAQYKEIMARPIIIPLHIFQKFIPLYTRRVAESVNPIDKQQVNDLGLLSEELLRLINPFKPYHVRLPDGRLIGFPPIYNYVCDVASEHVTSVDRFANVLAKCQDQQWRMNTATSDIIAALAASQDPNVVRQQATQFITQTLDCARQMTGLRDGKGITSTAVVGTPPAEPEGTTPDAYGEWVLD